MKGYKIAELTVNMETFGRTFQHAEKYTVSDQPFDDPQITINISDKKRSRLLENLKGRCSEDMAEYMLSGREFYRQLIDFNGFMLHSSAVVLEDKAYLFSADSGVGKSTHTALWRQCFPEAYILNDDKPAIRLLEGKFFVYGTPWSGKTEQNENRKVELGGICFLHRSSQNEISPMETKKAIENLLMQTVRLGLKEPEFTKIYAVWDRLLSEYQIYDLGCLADRQAAYLSSKVLKGSRK